MAGALGVESQTYSAYSHMNYTTEQPYGGYIAMKELLKHVHFNVGKE